MLLTVKYIEVCTLPESRLESRETMNKYEIQIKESIAATITLLNQKDFFKLTGTELYRMQDVNAHIRKAYSAMPRTLHDWEKAVLEYYEKEANKVKKYEEFLSILMDSDPLSYENLEDYVSRKLEKYYSKGE